MRILVFARSLECGGAERQLVAVANGLAEQGHDVRVALFYSGGSLEKELVDVPIIQLAKKGRWDIISFCKRLVHAVQAFRPDSMYSFLGTPNILAVVLKVFWRNTQIVWSVRASDMDYSHYDKVAAMANWVEARLAPHADLIIANSKAGKAHASARGMPLHKCIVIPNGIDTDRFFPDRLAGVPLREQWVEPQGDILIGLVARVDPMKDHETFLKAACKVVECDAGVRFVCIGDGAPSFLASVKQLADSLGLGNFLTWAGELDYMESAYNALDICCLSSMTEGFPNVIGEAMSCNIPCVVTNVGDAALIVGDTGLVVPRRNPDALAEAMLEMVGNVRSGLCGMPRQRIVSKFSLEQMIWKTEKALQA